MDNNIQRNVENIQNGANKKGSFNFREVHVFTMPKGGRRTQLRENNGAEDAKKTGFIILILGSFFLIAILGAAYYYLVMKPKTQEVISNTDNSAQEQTAEKTKEEKTSPKEVEDRVVSKKTEKKTEFKKSPETTADSKNEKAEENVSSEKEEPSKEAEEEKTTTFMVVDKDADGLSMEEEVVAGTSDTAADTDNDSYNDLAEMLSGYNPLGEGPIEDDANFVKFENKYYHFSFVYPKIFTISANTNESLILDLGNQEFFQIFVDKNEDDYSIEDWYKKQFGVNVIDKKLLSKKGDWNVIKNADSESFFFKNDRDGYIIAYNYSSAGNRRYENIFNIVFNTFKMTE